MIPYSTDTIPDARPDDAPGDRAPAPTRSQAAATTGPPAWSRGEVLAVLGLSIGLAVAASWTLGRQSLTGDEAATWAISGHRFGDVLHVLGSSGGDRAAGLYYVVLHAWVRVFGTSAAALRSLSVVAAVVTLPVFYAVARRLGRGVAWVAVPLLAASPLFLSYARQARAYSLAVALVVAAAWAFLRALDTDDPRRWTAFVALAALALYTQWFAGLVVAAFYVAALTVARPQLASRRATRATGCLVVLAAPIVGLVLAGDTGGVGWIAPLSVAQLRDLARTLASTHVEVSQLLVFAVAAVGLGTALGRSRRRSPHGSSLAVAMAATWFLVPTVLLVAVSVAKPVLVSRYLLVALPGFALLLALGLTAILRGRVPLLVVGVVVLSVLGWSAYGPLWAGRHVDEDWSGIARTVAQRGAPGQAILVYPASAVYAVGYYARGLTPLDGQVGPAWPPVPWATPYGRGTPRPASLLRTAATVRASLVWLVIRRPVGPTISRSTSNPADLQAVEHALARRCPDREVVRTFARRTASLVRYAGCR